ncbi:3-hydroxyacyl-CoA dehydrogenase family protein [Novosphingobium mangrovi (ex Huang et al. 2023)]|uniref:3-hydroxyacyl-CoA dehydrogenase family protein n=1 Tax=Novosphingobium mangrovi (ex Huang et al. 2023) TaxID=2976432 RepID=A0ABT2I8S0_9SPHN|nr:3-hydroxyacyl-CoA dehydrogenase family protein [Novosphingobium mangrovi (ex Huang et al. 2023)]MCT2401208.1 3-hydroxyacyl-CoA dehydrogenase family protein [Novosphingobium mangrovi (ex Huang et al. 2023)]
MAVTVIRADESRSFAIGEDLAFGEGNGVVLVGSEAGGQLAAFPSASRDFVAVELGSECLAEHLGLEESEDNVRTVGFARFRMGDAQPTRLVELVKMPWTDPAAVEAARACFENAGLTVAVCEDFAGRIVDRLIRPYLNAVLRRLDDGLASAADMDRTLMLGLGYPEGPLALLKRTGLAAHHDVSAALYQQLADPDFAPARRAQVVAARR